MSNEWEGDIESEESVIGGVFCLSTVQEQAKERLNRAARESELRKAVSGNGWSKASRRTDAC